MQLRVGEGSPGITYQQSVVRTIKRMKKIGITDGRRDDDEHELV